MCQIYKPRPCRRINTRNSQMQWSYGNSGQFKVISLFLWARGFLCFLIDGHLQGTAVLFPCSLSQGVKEAVRRITLFHLFHFVLFLALQCITREGSIAYTGLSRRRRCLVQPETDMCCTVGDGDVLYGRRRKCTVWPETGMSRMAGDGDVSSGRRRCCLVWAETVMSRMAGDDCGLWYQLMAFSRTSTFIYILALWPSSIESIKLL
jgi:hypothetical protein